MYNKFHNTIITDSFKEIPVNELVEGIQIITFDSDKDYYSELPVDATKTMIFTGQIFGKVLRLQGVINTPCYDWTERDDKVKILGVNYNQKEFGQLLVDFDNQLIEIMYQEDNRRTEIYFISASHEYEDKQMSMLSEIHNNIFTSHGNKDVIYNQFNADETISYHFLSIPLDNDNAIVFIYEHNIDISKKIWRVHKHSWVMSRNLEAIEVNDVNEVINKFSQTSVGKNPNFIAFNTDEKFIANYDMTDFLHANKNAKDAFEKIKEVFKFLRPKLEIEKLFKPFYINEQLDFKAYIAGYKDFRAGFYFKYNGNFINKYKIKGLDNEQELKDEMRIAEAMFSFFERSNSGINPIDGLCYKDGILNITSGTECLYRDADAMLIKFKYEYQATAFIRIKNYFIKADNNNERDKEMVKAMYERKATMERLLKSK